MKKLIILCSVVLLSGCTTTKLKQGDWEFSRSATGNKTAIGNLEVTRGTNGEFTIKLDSYSNDQVEALRAIAAGVAEGMTKGAAKAATGGVAP